MRARIPLAVAGVGNLIVGSSSEDSGILLQGANGNSNLVQGNFIGTDFSGNVALGNLTDGVDIQSSLNTIGGTVAGDRNLIDNSINVGIAFQTANSHNNLIEGNYVGVGADGQTALGNANVGVDVFSDDGFNTIGGTAAGAGNVISGNGGDGIRLLTSNNLVEGDFIGTNAAGMAALGNTQYGIEITGGAQSNLIGTNGDGVHDAAEDNLISGNVGGDVYIHGSGTSYNVVAGNYIGTDVTGMISLELLPYGPGVAIAGGATYNRIGTDGNSVDDAGERNVIAGNGAQSVYIHDVGTEYNSVAGNYIGVDATGEHLLAAGTATALVINSGASYNTIGTSGNTAHDTDERNIIGGAATSDAIKIENSSNNNIVAGNYIGVGANGSTSLGKTNNGIEIYSGSYANVIGSNGQGDVAAEGNVISGFGADGISIHDTGTIQNIVAGNYIGTNAAGTAALANGGDGVEIYSGSNGNTIGGTAAGAGNVISGNTGNGVEIDSSSNILVAGNYIGTNAGGTAALGNRGNGISVQSGSTNVTIGGTVAGAANVISGNSGSAPNYICGINMGGAGTSNNLIEGNFIGTDKTGTVALGNAYDGISIGGGASSNTVGGTSAAARNIISANAADGVEFYVSGSGNVIEGNYIGTDVTGTHALGSQTTGIVDGTTSSGNIIGGTTAGAGNLISGNTGDGIYIYRADSGNNLIAGNFIGVNAAGTGAVANGGIGIYLSSGSNTIGGSTAVARNVISGNASYGVQLDTSSATGNLVEGDYLGTNATGTAAVPNTHYGVYISGGGSNTIGGLTSTPGTGAGNVISGNTSNGVLITGSTAIDNVVEGNLVGTNAAGAAALTDPGRGNGGVYLSNGASSNTIGGTATGARNVISGNPSSGIDISTSGATTSNNVIQGNYIGTDITGTVAIGNENDGVALENGVTNTLIGADGSSAGADLAARNIISANAFGGVGIFGAGNSGNVVAGNYIGVDVTGTVALGNQGAGLVPYLGIDGTGVSIFGSASNNRIGPSGAEADNAGERNVISGNAGPGVYINNSELLGYGTTGPTTGNLVAGNFIGTDYTGTMAVGNGVAGVQILSAINTAANTIGGTSVALRNIISGNTGNGVQIDGSSDFARRRKLYRHQRRRHGCPGQRR